MMLLAALIACTAIDGDTLRCGPERIRMLGIDSPEIPGHCRRGRVCAPGDPYAARDALARMIRGGVTVEPVTRDRYGRTVAIVRDARGRNLSCRMLAGGWAVYVARWDNRGLIGRECGR